MGLFGNLFGGKSSAPSSQELEAQAIADAEKAEAERKQKEADDLLEAKKKKDSEYTARSLHMKGGGREGLMFMKNQTGVM